MVDPVVIGDACLYLGDCLEILPNLPKADACITDPPYGLSFMGKRWDYDVPSVEIWAECLRVLKPGGHLLAFAGTRTQHRMAVRIEDAGFEIRDMIAWVYGSGFPKSLDVSKAIDKHGPSGQVPFAEFAAHYEARRKASGLTHAQVCAAGGWHGATNHGGTSANWANGYGMPTAEQWAILQPLLGLGDEWAVRVEREQYEREVIGKRAVSRGVAFTSDGPDEIPITAPATEAARQWQGWGTALKPALEPITVARKPLGGTVAANVMAHGTGALNIDGCRVGTEDMSVQFDRDWNQDGTFGNGKRASQGKQCAPGRWPANLIHDGSDEVLAGFPESTSGAMTTSTRRASQDAPGSVCYGTYGGNATSRDIAASKGSSSRFFYCAKASKSDRGAENIHPTVKPTDLMRYLCRLVTPPGGLVFDPFMGSGSTGVAALREGFNFIGIEREPKYFDIACRRIEQAYKQRPLFEAEQPPKPVQLGLEAE